MLTKSSSHVSISCSPVTILCLSVSVLCSSISMLGLPVTISFSPVSISYPPFFFHRHFFKTFFSFAEWNNQSSWNAMKAAAGLALSLLPPLSVALMDTTMLHRWQKKNFLHLLLLGYWCVSPKKNQRVDKSFQIINVGQSSAVSCCVDTDAGAAGRRSSSPLTGGQVPLLGAALWLMMNVFPTASLLTNPHSGFLLIYIRFLILTLHEETVGNDSSVWLPFSKCTVSSEWVIFLPRSPS